MTRINCGIPPAELTDKHLLAEHREIKRIPNMVKSGRANLDNIPEKFTLGKGHVRFFYDKLLFLHERYMVLYEECKRRGFKVSRFSAAFSAHTDDCLIGKEKFINLYNGYTPTESDKAIVRQRIADRLNGIK